MPSSSFVFLFAALGVIYVLRRVKLVSFEQFTVLALVALAVTLADAWAGILGNTFLGILVSAISVGFIGLIARRALEASKKQKR